MTQIKFIVYSDIHHDRFAAKCIRLQDTLEIEQQVFKRALEGGFDFTLFCGDRYLRREPEDEVKTKADRLIFDNMHFAAAEVPGFNHYSLVGNHDWTHNSMKWHTSESLKRFANLYVFDGSYFTVAASDYCIHALPAGFTFDINHFQVDPAKLNVFMFHDLVKGSYIDEGGKHTFVDGVSLIDLDRPEFDIVFGGDNHVPQKLSFKDTKGGYVGAVLQRTRGDANRPRGWVEVIATKESVSWAVETQFVPTRNFFTRAVFDVSSGTRFEDLGIGEEQVTDQSVEVTLKGEKSDIDRLATDERWGNYVTFGGARGIDIAKGYEVEQSDVVVDMSQSSSLVDDLVAYLDSGFVDIGILSRERLIEEVKE